MLPKLYLAMYINTGMLDCKNISLEARMKYELSNISIMFILLIAVLLSCGSNPGGPSVPRDVLGAPHQVYIDGNSYGLETSLWRDFMPICPPGGTPLAVVIYAKEIHFQPIPDYIHCDLVWVINDNEVWQTELSEYDRPDNLTLIKAYAGNGPKWEPGSKVDVVVRLIDNDLKYYLLKASNQPIGRTD